MPATATDHRSDAYQGDSKHKGKFFTADMNKRSNECYVFLQKTQFLFDPKEKFSVPYTSRYKVGIASSDSFSARSFNKSSRCYSEEKRR